jgi:hypothetical protein
MAAIVVGIVTSNQLKEFVHYPNQPQRLGAGSLACKGGALLRGGVIVNNSPVRLTIWF